MSDPSEHREQADGVASPQRSSAARRAAVLFRLACVVEGSLLLVAALVAWAADRPLLADLRWSAGGLLAGAVAVAPMLAAFVFLMRSPRAYARRIRGFVARFLRGPALPWSAPQVAVVCVLAGLGEEALFRGAIQGALSDWLGPLPALAAASVLFGCAHLVTPAYGVIAALMGVYLGILWIASGNLLVPVVAHAGYDFVALYYLLRRWRPPAGEGA